NQERSFNWCPFPRKMFGNDVRDSHVPMLVSKCLTERTIIFSNTTCTSRTLSKLTKQLHPQIPAQPGKPANIIPTIPAQPG
ncbi:16616_t:CDS:2, partial [Gigaspora rosea]